MELQSPKDYANNYGCSCPVCGSDKLTTPLQPIVYGADIKHYIQCLACKAYWYDVYIIDSYVGLTKGDSYA